MVRVLCWRRRGCCSSEAQLLSAGTWRIARAHPLRVTSRGVPLWLQVETGNPFMLYKDSANRKSNQQNLGTIKSSNLCTGGLAIHANFLNQ